LFAVGKDQGAQPFTEQRKVVVNAVKLMFSELRNTCDRNIQADKMADAHADLETAKAMLVLRDVFSADAITLDKAVEEMHGVFDQKASGFAQRVGDALQHVRFGELNTLLLGYRDVASAAKQEEYSNALNRVTEAGEAKYDAMLQCRSSPASATMCAVGC